MLTDISYQLQIPAQNAQTKLLNVVLPLYLLNVPLDISNLEVQLLVLLVELEPELAHLPLLFQPASMDTT